MRGANSPELGDPVRAVPIAVQMLDAGLEKVFQRRPGFGFLRLGAGLGVRTVSFGLGSKAG